MKTKQIAEGALCLAFYALLVFLFVYLPVVGTIATFFSAVPFIYLTAKYGWKFGGFFFLGSLAVSFMIGSFASLPVTVLFGLTGTVAGWTIHAKKGRGVIFACSVLAFLLNLIAQYAAAAVFFHWNAIEEMKDMIDESVEMTEKIMRATGQNMDDAQYDQLLQLSQLFSVLLPSFFVIISAAVVLIIQWVSFPAVRRMGIEIPKAVPFRELSFPKSIIWYYLAVLVLSLFVETDASSFLYQAVTNLSYILQLVFTVQGAAFLFFFFHARKVSKAVPAVLTILCLLNPLFLLILRIVGIMDLGFDLRSKIRPQR